MKTAALLVAASLATATAFVPAAAPQQSSTRLHVATKGKVGPVRKAIDNLDKDNFAATLSEIEPFLTTEAGRTIYSKSLRRIAVKAGALGVEVPAGYAKDAKCTAKRRAKQDEYCQAKAEEAAAAAAEEAEAAADAAAAEVEAAAEEEAAEETAEETAEEPAPVEA